jgi:hypothetical protein
VGFQFVSPQVCDSSNSDAETYTTLFAPAIRVPKHRVQGTVRCGSLIVDLYVVTPTPTDVAVVQAAIAQTFATAPQAASVFGIPVERINQPYVTTIAVLYRCVEWCDVFLDGARPDSPAHSFLCMKTEAHGTNCKPMYNTQGCPSGMKACHASHTPVDSVAPGTGAPACQDTPGKWASKKCAKKVRKNKCQKRKVQSNCKASCGMC